MNKLMSLLPLKRDRSWDLLFILVAAIISTAYFVRFLSINFTFDDFKYLENLLRKDYSVLLGYGSLRVVSNLFWWPLYHLCGLNPLGYNLLGILVYTANAVLAYFFLTRLTSNRPLSFFAATLFIASASGIDVVFWKSTNSSLFALFFYLLTLHTYIIYRISGLKWSYPASILLFAFAMLSKEDSASLPLIIILIELYHSKLDCNIKRLSTLLSPYCFIVFAYILSDRVVFKLMLEQNSTMTLFNFRPLYSIFGGGNAFFLNPNGELPKLTVYLFAAIIVLAILIVARERKVLLFALGWIFLTFLPQSLGGSGHLKAEYLVDSISRYLYFPSIGSSLFMAASLLELRTRLKKTGIIACTILFAGFLKINYSRVIDRGTDWDNHARVIENLIYTIKKNTPDFPQGAKFHIMNAPVGRAFAQQAFRVYFRNPTITWTDNPYEELHTGSGPVYLIEAYWNSANVYKLR